MRKNASHQMFRRAHSSRWTSFKQEFENLTNVLASNSKERKLQAAKSLANSAEVLGAILAQEDHPSWLSGLRSQLQRVIDHPQDESHLVNLLKIVANNFIQISQYSWDFDAPRDSFSQDFDAIYEEAYEASKLPQLFRDLLRFLEEMVSNGTIDSKLVTIELTTMIDLIKRNEHGSFLAKTLSAKFLRRFSTNFLWGLAETVPAVGPLVEAFRETLSEFEEEEAKLNARVREKVEAEAPKSIFRDGVRIPPPFALEPPKAAPLPDPISLEAELLDDRP